MKKSHSIFIIGIIFCIISGIGAQDLQLTFGKKTKTIKAGTYIEVRLPVLNQEPCVKCRINSVTGKLISFENGKLNLLIHHSTEPLTEGNSNIGYSDKYYEKKGSEPKLAIPANNILSITLKGKNKLMERTTGEAMGVILILFGTGTLFSYYAEGIAGEDPNIAFRNLGIYEIVAGIILGSVFRHKVYITSFDCPQKNHNRKIWVLN